MYETTIQLNAINDVKDFVNKVMLFNYDIDLVSGRYAIDAKSIMGIFSLDLSKPIKLQAHTDDADKLVEAIGKYRLSRIVRGKNGTPETGCRFSVLCCCKFFSKALPPHRRREQHQDGENFQPSQKHICRQHHFGEV